MMLPIMDIRRDGATQARERLSDDTVRAYAALMAPDDGGDPETFPPPVVYYDGTSYWLADGYHRVAAAEMAGAVEMEVEVRSGTRDAAVWHAAGANARHGLPMTATDKRRALRMLLAVDAFARMPPAELAAHVGVGLRTAQRARAEACLPPMGGLPDHAARARVAAVVEAAEAAGEDLSLAEVARRAETSRDVARAAQRGGRQVSPATPSPSELPPGEMPAPERMTPREAGDMLASAIRAARAHVPGADYLLKVWEMSR